MMGAEVISGPIMLLFALLWCRQSGNQPAFGVKPMTWTPAPREISIALITFW